MDRIIPAFVAVFGLVFAVFSREIAQVAWTQGKPFRTAGTPVIAYRIMFLIGGLSMAVLGTLAALGLLPLA